MQPYVIHKPFIYYFFITDSPFKYKINFSNSLNLLVLVPSHTQNSLETE